MTLRDLYEGRRIQVSFPPPGVIGIHWLDAIVCQVKQHSVALMLVGHPLWRKHYVGITVNARDCAAGLVRAEHWRIA